MSNIILENVSQFNLEDFSEITQENFEQFVEKISDIETPLEEQKKDLTKLLEKYKILYKKIKDTQLTIKEKTDLQKIDYKNIDKHMQEYLIIKDMYVTDKIVQFVYKKLELKYSIPIKHIKDVILDIIRGIDIKIAYKQIIEIITMIPLDLPIFPPSKDNIINIHDFLKENVYDFINFTNYNKLVKHKEYIDGFNIGRTKEEISVSLIRRDNFIKMRTPADGNCWYHSIIEILKTLDTSDNFKENLKTKFINFIVQFKIDRVAVQEKIKDKDDNYLNYLFNNETWLDTNIELYELLRISLAYLIDYDYIQLKYPDDIVNFYNNNSLYELYKLIDKNNNMNVFKEKNIILALGANEDAGENSYTNEINRTMYQEAMSYNRWAGSYEMQLVSFLLNININILTNIQDSFILDGINKSDYYILKQGTIYSPHKNPLDIYIYYNGTTGDGTHYQSLIINSSKLQQEPPLQPMLQTQKVDAENDMKQHYLNIDKHFHYHKNDDLYHSHPHSHQKQSHQKNYNLEQLNVHLLDGRSHSKHHNQDEYINAKEIIILPKTYLEQKTKDYLETLKQIKERQLKIERLKQELEKI